MVCYGSATGPVDSFYTMGLRRLRLMYSIVQGMATGWQLGIYRFLRGFSYGGGKMERGGGGVYHQMETLPQMVLISK